MTGLIRTVFEKDPSSAIYTQNDRNFDGKYTWCALRKFNKWPWPFIRKYAYLSLIWMEKYMHQSLKIAMNFIKMCCFIWTTSKYVIIVMRSAMCSTEKFPTIWHEKRSIICLYSEQLSDIFMILSRMHFKFMELLTEQGATANRQRCKYTSNSICSLSLYPFRFKT